jgi:hypothetical protein
MERLLKSTFPINFPIGGISTSLANELTISPNAAPKGSPRQQFYSHPQITNKQLLSINYR